MTNIIEQIRDEHRNMAKLLDALERQIAVFSEGGQPDYEVILGALDYFLDYPDRCHHPKEDLLARKIIEGTDTAGPLQKLEARFAELVRRVLDEAELSRSDLTRAATEFIATQRHHMEMEEEHFLPLAETALGPEELAELASELTAEADPLMDPDAEARYSNLRDTILSWRHHPVVGGGGSRITPSRARYLLPRLI
jgi:hemerythrin-like domain-containing protein